MHIQSLLSGYAPAIEYYKYTAPTGEIMQKTNVLLDFQPELDSVCLFATLFVLNYSFGNAHLQ